MWRKINLICLPYAGGSAYSYNNLQAFMPGYVRMTSVDLPGRGKRMQEPLLKNAPCAVNDIYRTTAHLYNQPYAIFGHSMGALLGYLLTRKIIQEQHKPPVHLFFSGRGGPSARRNEIHYNLPQEDFFLALEKLGGCPEEILRDGDLRNLFEPVLRADFELVETFGYANDAPFEIPMDIFYGSDEGITPFELDCWKRECALPVHYTSFDGDHFFLLSQPASVAQVIFQKLNKYV